MIAVTLVLILLGAVRISLLGSLLAASLLFMICLPASRLIARLVEKKKHTFTIGGASFTGIILAPLVILLAEKIMTGYGPCSLPLIPVMAALATGYTLGEGLGRLACLSYGCCYGKPIKDCSPTVQRIFKRTGHIFYGENKKASYESQLNGIPLIPVQAITCILYTTAAIFSSWLFLHGRFTFALLFSIIVTQVWRFFSETMRADYRGDRKISAYQIMGIIAVCYIAVLNGFSFQAWNNPISVIDGIRSLWNPVVILGLQIFWLIFFLYFGRSTITSATVLYTLHNDRI